MHPQFVEFCSQDPLYTQATRLRNRLLRLPLGLDLFGEDLAREHRDRHFGLLDQSTLVACLVITPLEEQRVKLRQMCVAEEHQGGGWGRHLVSRTEEILQRDGILQIELAARLPARRFYERLGYQSVGEVFTEVTIDHIKMVKRLEEHGARNTARADL
jgi:hypothetical protein